MTTQRKLGNNCNKQVEEQQSNLLMLGLIAHTLIQGDDGGSTPASWNDCVLSNNGIDNGAIYTGHDAGTSRS